MILKEKILFSKEECKSIISYNETHITNWRMGDRNYKSQPINYSLETNFTPPVMSVGPVSGFINNVNTESTLRNQFFALQKGADQSVYIPSSNSDLYKVTVVSRPEEQPYPLLFENGIVIDKSLHSNIRNNPHIGKDTFHNYTRTQLRNGKTNDKC
jgi:hypothetical protein